MTQPIRNRLAALALVLQVLAVFATTRGVVLCVGPAGHVAVEDAQDAARCKASQVDLTDDSSGGGPAVGAPPACSDTPVFAAAPDRGLSAVRFEAPALAVAPVALLPRPAISTLRARTWAGPRPAHARILRSVVLLI